MKLFLGKFKTAFLGLFRGLCEDFSIRTQYILALTAVLISSFFIKSIFGWIFLFGVICLVLAFEYFNSAIEEIVNYISPQYSEAAKKIKDFSAAAVLLVAIFALFIGACIVGGVF